MPRNLPMGTYLIFFDDSYDFCFCNEALLPALHEQILHAAYPHTLPCGRFAAQVSIANGTGSASTDRLMQFVDGFATFEVAVRYAVAQGIDWVNDILRARSAHLYPNTALSKCQSICI